MNSGRRSNRSVNDKSMKGKDNKKRRRGCKERRSDGHKKKKRRDCKRTKRGNKKRRSACAVKGKRKSDWSRRKSKGCVSNKNAVSKKGRTRNAKKKSARSGRPDRFKSKRKKKIISRGKMMRRIVGIARSKRLSKASRLRSLPPRRSHIPRPFPSPRRLGPPMQKPCPWATRPTSSRRLHPRARVPWPYRGTRTRAPLLWPCSPSTLTKRPLPSPPRHRLQLQIPRKTIRPHGHGRKPFTKPSNSRPLTLMRSLPP
mmetsp:Transcript_58580/g.104493  ORF Transcript_58580/g.104493 Transcript_58580/m.104493 type:complete len:256 (-) Transcript_58580:1007-1774(-)